MDFYISQPLSVECKNLEDLRGFLRKCRYVSDEEQFGLADFWMPPEEFERSRKGDCEDFALYAWRQLLSLGYSARPRLPKAQHFGLQAGRFRRLDGEKAHFYSHSDRKFTPPVRQIPAFVLESVYYYVRLMFRAAYVIPVGLAKREFRRLQKVTNR